MGVSFHVYGIIDEVLTQDVVSKIISNGKMANIDYEYFSFIDHKSIEINPSIDIAQTIWEKLKTQDQVPYVYLSCDHVKRKLDFGIALEKFMPQQVYITIVARSQSALRKLLYDKGKDTGLYVQILLDVTKGLPLRDIDTALY